MVKNISKPFKDDDLLKSVVSGGLKFYTTFMPEPEINSTG